MEKDLLSNFPLTYNCLVIESTTRCTAKCSMCYQSSGPKGSELLGDNQLSTATIKKVIREAVNIPTLKPHFHLAGGEAFLNIPSCIDCFEEAKKNGYTEISATTNAYWAKDEEKAARVCRDIREAGLTRMEVSWDAWHLDFIPISAVNNCIKSAYDNNIQIILRILSTKEETAEVAIAMLDSEALSCLDSVCCAPVMHTGRAVKNIPKSEIFNIKNVGYSCHSLLNLTINASGNVFPCCAGFDQTKTVQFGNIKDSSIIEIAESMNSSLLLRFLVFSGAGSLVPILEDAGFELGRDFSSLCNLCWSIFSNQEMAETIKNYFQKLQ
ncbi:MAG: radical SAM protein [Okeania sp. SIO2F4]|uniref:radical SAM/SPASM domain-containing protein n=1 Tax=Okeania sp. SIO2F4 TaxID=2607790 RepID=UPI00142D0AB9|nr:radical SAM protein [Okeania sp. SIO2F4]NES03403.1 radical SAM protein [Okeania sp. SIO2F4]